MGPKLFLINVFIALFNIFFIYILPIVLPIVLYCLLYCLFVLPIDPLPDELLPSDCCRVIARDGEEEGEGEG